MMCFVGVEDEGGGKLGCWDGSSLDLQQVRICPNAGFG